MRLKSVETLHEKGRISSVDIFRSIAIISVVVYHFNKALPFGYTGVDLFFVISGLLVGGLLTKQFQQGEKVNFFKFVLQRGFKIWPSYYTFLLVGTLLAIGLYGKSNPEQIIQVWDFKRYVFFYQNYTGQPFHWSFDHVWSLCVEEHFYIMLPLLFLFIQFVMPERIRVQSLFVFVLLTIGAGIAFKFISYYFTRSQDTYSGTHNRIDALAWGVLLNLILVYKKEWLQQFRYKYVLFLAGLLLLAGCIFMHASYGNILFNKVLFHSFLPVSFFLMLAGLYFVDFSRLKVLRFIAYYSYNWYLWHPLFIIFITRQLGDTIPGFVTYLVCSFSAAMLFTILIEEPFLKWRKPIIGRIFGKKTDRH